MKYGRAYLFVFLCLGWFAFHSLPVAAAMPGPQLVDDTAGDLSFSTPNQSFGDGWEGELKDMSFKFRTSGSTDIAISFGQNSGANCDNPSEVQWNLYTDSGCTTREVVTIPGDTLWQFDFSTGYRKATTTCVNNATAPLILDPALSYCVYFSRWDGSTYGLFGSASDVFAGGAAYSPAGNTVADDYFLFNEADQATLTPISPTDGQNILTSPVHFSGTYSVPVNVYDYVFYIINKGTVASSTYYYFFIDPIPAGETSGAYDVGVPLPDGYYMWTAFLYNSSGLASTTPLGPYQLSVGLMPDADLCDDIDLLTVTGQIQCALMRVVEWAFFPSAESKQDLKNSYDELKECFPFSAFYDVTDSMQAAIASTSTSTSGSFLDMPMVRKTATGSEFYMLPGISSSTVANAIGSANAVTFRTTISYLMWTITGLIVVYTLWPKK